MPRKKVEEIKVKILDFPDGSQKPAYSLVDGAAYLGMSTQTMTAYLKKHPEIRRFRREIGGIELYILEEDLKKLNMAYPVDANADIEATEE